jgi:hypothetical protein
MNTLKNAAFVVGLCCFIIIAATVAWGLVSAIIDTVQHFDWVKVGVIALSILIIVLFIYDLEKH